MLGGSTFLSRTALSSQDLGGMVLTPGFYIFASAAFFIALTPQYCISGTVVPVQENSER